MRNINLSLHFSKIISATTTIVCLLCCFPQQGLYAALPIQNVAVDMAKLTKEIGTHIFSLEEIATCLPPYATHVSLKSSLTKSFENLAHLINKAPNSHEATTQFFQSFIDQINIQKNTDGTIEEACHIIRQKMYELSIPDEYREHLLLGLDVMQIKEIAIRDDLCSKVSMRIYWPWEWNWFGLNKKDKKHDEHLKSAHEKIGKWEIIAFALFCCAVVLVAVFAPAVLSVVIPALTTGAEILL